MNNYNKTIELVIVVRDGIIFVAICIIVLKASNIGRHINRICFEQNQ